MVLPPCFRRRKRRVPGGNPGTPKSKPLPVWGRGHVLLPSPEARASRKPTARIPHSFKFWHRAPSEAQGLSHFEQTLNPGVPGLPVLQHLSMPPGSGLCVAREPHLPRTRMSLRVRASEGSRTLGLLYARWRDVSTKIAHLEEYTDLGETWNTPRALLSKVGRKFPWYLWVNSPREKPTRCSRQIRSLLRGGPFSCPYSRQCYAYRLYFRQDYALMPDSG
jgi:hypothetical protein